MKTILILAAAITATACTSQRILQVNSEIIGGSGSYQKYAEIRVPNETCDTKAYQDGFIGGYAVTWNDWVGAKEQTYYRSSFGVTGESPSRKNLAIYQNKQFSLAGLNYNSYPYSESGASRDSSARCAVISYGNGRNAGTAAAALDFKELEKQEVK